jgi:hypothetical protein
MIETRTTKVWLDGEILRGQERPGTETTLEDARALVAALREVGGGVRRMLVMDISESKSVSRDARAYLSGDEMAKAVSVLALVVGSALARALGSFFLTFNRPKFGAKLFSSLEEAVAWARSQPAP